jgi:hypothetical protein
MFESEKDESSELARISKEVMKETTIKIRVVMPAALKISRILS